MNRGIIVKGEKSGKGSKVLLSGAHGEVMNMEAGPAAGLRIESTENVTEQSFVASQKMLPCQSPQPPQFGVDLPPQCSWVEL